MRNKIIKRFVIGTCSVCFAYALTADSVRALVNTGDDTQATDTAAAVPTIENVESTTASAAAAEVWPYNAPIDASTTGKRSKRDQNTTYTTDAVATAAGQTITQTAETTTVEESAAIAETQVAAVAATTAVEEQATTVTTQTDTASAPPSLSQYLSALRCGGCRHNCLLVSPRCAKGRTKAQSATVEYYELYGS